MSNVTEVILVASIMEDEAWLGPVNAFFAREDRQENEGDGLRDVDAPCPHDARWKGYGGTKRLQVRMAIGAINYLDLDAFVAHLKKLAWTDPEDLQLLVHREHDELGIFREVEVFPETRKRAEWERGVGPRP